MSQHTTIYSSIAVFQVVVLATLISPVLAKTVTQFTQTILNGPQSIEIIDESGTSVAAPAVTIALPESSPLPQVVTAVLGSAQQRIRILNPSVDTPWSVSIAATQGPTALWSDGSNTYDYNDSQDGSDGPDPDTRGGALAIDPSSSVLAAYPSNGNCPSTGLSLGTPSSFNEHGQEVSSVTLISGSPVVAAYCQWDVTGIKLQQIVPGQQPPSQYNLDFTITII